ncbi:MAG: shikimate dehydrogenase [Usitatibacter sp.]
MDRYVVAGNPVSHSLSPDIHAHFAASVGENIEYGRLLVPQGEFASHLARFFEDGGSGANVTLPFKVDAFEFATASSARAQRAGAANFLLRRGNVIECDNTDGVGLVADLTRNLGVVLAGARILLLGAGGAARGVIAPLLAEGPSALLIANRTQAKASELARSFDDLGAVEACALDAIGETGADLVINATSSSTRGESLALPAGTLGKGVFAYDMAYGASAKPFVARATDAGARASDGLGMLVEQAAESYFLWRGKRPATSAVLAELRSRFA